MTLCDLVGARDHESVARQLGVRMPIVELKTWQMDSERCAPLGSMLTSSAAFHRRRSSSTLLTSNPSLASVRVCTEGLHFSAFLLYQVVAINVHTCMYAQLCH